jgi:hypothetical protein
MSLVKSLASFKIKQDFEEELLEKAKEFYCAESQRLLLSHDASGCHISVSLCAFDSSAAYLSHAEHRIQEEIDRINQCLEERTRRPLLQVCMSSFEARASTARRSLSTSFSLRTVTKSLAWTRQACWRCLKRADWMV